MAYTFKEIKEEKFYNHFRGVKKGYFVNSSDCLLLTNAPTYMKKIKSFKALADDIYAVTYPKTGTALVQEAVHLILNDVNNEDTLNIWREQIFPYLEFPIFDVSGDFFDPIGFIENNPSPRMIKTHLPYSLMPPEALSQKSKMIYLSRNIRDMTISFYNFARVFTMLDFEGDFDDFLDLFLDNLVPYGSYISHVKSFWEKRNEPNILFLTFEEMKMNSLVVIKRIANFLGKEISEEDVKKIADQCSFEKMKQNPAINKDYMKSINIAKKGFAYFRKGQVGEWKDNFSTEQNKKIIKLLHDQVNDPELRQIIEGNF